MLWPSLRIASHLLIRNSQGLVLTFHYIGQPVLAGVGEDLFISHLEYCRILDLVVGKLTPLPPIEFLGRLKEGALPAGATMITFDDCPRTTVLSALPELRQRGLAACFFISPGLIGSGRTVPSVELMSLCASAAPGEYRVRHTTLRITDAASRIDAYRRLWPELLRTPSNSHVEWLGAVRPELGLTDDSCPLPLAEWDILQELRAAGMLIGNHTMLHSTASADGSAQFGLDVAQAYECIEQRLGRQHRVFCYPYGRAADQSAATEQALASIGTEFAFVTQGGIANAKRSGCLNLHREDAAYSASATKLAPLLAFLR